jgi:hypothetical protein
MLQRADDLIKSGDLSSARLLLTRVAEAGDARSSFTLAGTFDPNVLKALGVQDGVPGVALAVFGMSEPPNSVRPMRRDDSSNLQPYRSREGAEQEFALSTYRSGRKRIGAANMGRGRLAAI